VKLPTEKQAEQLHKYPHTFLGREREAWCGLE